VTARGVRDRRDRRAAAAVGALLVVGGARWLTAGDVRSSLDELSRRTVGRTATRLLSPDATSRGRGRWIDIFRAWTQRDARDHQ